MNPEPEYTVILANGAFPRRKSLLALLHGAAHIVCCDGAAASLLRHGLTPDLVVGDLDSLSPALRKKLGRRVIRVTEQETNDLSKAFRACMERSWRTLVILGAGGKREDHLLGNASLLPQFAAAGADVRMETDCGTFLPVLKSSAFRRPVGTKVSVFSFHPDMPVTSTGLAYPLVSLRLPFWWSGTLNVTDAPEFSLAFDGRAPLLLYFPR
ncbi:MAG: thiamine diphosphokinase [Lentisphaeria bacterium]|nr:thiamine diphosphokinase [Lentisphaeria bacterium]